MNQTNMSSTVYGGTSSNGFEVSGEFGKDATSTIHHLLNEFPVFLSTEHLLYKVLPVASSAAVAVTIIYLAVFPLAVRLLSSSSSCSTANNKKNDESITVYEHRQLAYQITNCITNAGLGTMGLYYQYALLPHFMNYNATESIIVQKIQGNEPLFALGAAQIGFQIWSIIMGLFMVEESKQMLLHHVAVIFASSKSVFLVNGFRYYAPLGLGMTELSSVPLSVMNAFKNHETWRLAYPQYYLASRLVFAAMFLIIRIGQFVPQHIEYLKLSGLVTYHAGAVEGLLGYRIFMAIAWVGSAFLLFLQILWGYLIVKGISNMFLSKVNIRVSTLDQKEKNN